MMSLCEVVRLPLIVEKCKKIKNTSNLLVSNLFCKF